MLPLVAGGTEVNDYINFPITPKLFSCQLAIQHSKSNIGYDRLKLSNDFIASHW